MRRVRLLVLATVGLLNHFAVFGESRPHPVDCGLDTSRCYDQDIPGGFCFQERSPVEFIDFLRSNVSTEFVIPYSVSGIHYGWVQESDRSSLEALETSTEPCLPVVSALSSYLPRRLSSAGNEARFLLLALETGRFPPALVSSYP